MSEVKAQLRLRMSSKDAHYQGDLVDGARILQLFGDAATEIMIRQDGMEGLFRAYSEVEFLAPVRAGDYLEVEGRLVQVGNTSRRIEFTAHKVIGEANVVDPPRLVARATGTCVAAKPSPLAAD